MSNRRKPRNQKCRSRAHAPADLPCNPYAGLEPWLEAMLEADAAESRGDAVGALKVMHRRPLDPDGRPFWRPSREFQLAQIVELGHDVPRWAVSRWILWQALHHLSEQERGCGPRTRLSRALRAVADLHGRPPSGSPTLGGSEAHERTQTIDHDWVYRQVHLFELGGLEAFLADGASADLIAGADRVRDWARAPMGGFTFVGAGSATLLWRDLATLETVVTPNIGSAINLVPGSTAIGRLVPAGDGVMFESAPLEVPRALARAVAADPAQWLDLLRDSGLVADGTICTEHRAWTTVMSDVPLVLTTLALARRPGEPELAAHAAPAEYARAALGLVREAMADLLVEPPHDADSDDEHEVWADWDYERESWHGWPYLHAILLDPYVISALAGVVTSEDLPLLEEVRDMLAEPASTWLGRLLDERAAAA